MDQKTYQSLTSDELASMVYPMTDTLRMEAAMVLWEAFNERTAGSFSCPVMVYRDNVGTCAARHDLMALVDPLHIGWHVHHHAAGDEGMLCPFDWEFTPWFLRTCVTFDATTITLKDDWLDLCRAARENL